ncbi:MAG: spore photoproduct lyase family protein [Nocardioidaceae bacterium]
MVRRCEAAGVGDIAFLSGNRLTGLSAESERETYARAKSTLAVVVAPPSALKPQPIPPSADWRIDLARGCPAHCQYCYLAGSLTGPPVTRVYANLDDVLAGIGTHAGRGSVTSGTAERGHEGTTFEMSCYTDPLGIEHLTGSLSAAITRVGSGEFGEGVSLRFTTKFDAVGSLVDLPHARRTRMRVSVNADEVAARFEGGTAPMPARLAALRTMALAGYRVGLTIAPVMPVPDWRAAYGQAAGRRGCRHRRRARPRPHRRDHHPPLHSRQQGRAAGVVPEDQARDGRGPAEPEAEQVRRGEVRLPARHRWARCAPGSPMRSCGVSPERNCSTGPEMAAASAS